MVRVCHPITPSPSLLKCSNNLIVLCADALINVSYLNGEVVSCFDDIKLI